MPQTIQLASHNKSMLPNAVQVIALDQNNLLQKRSNANRLKILELSDLLSRNLDVAQIIEAFMVEVSSEINFCGYRFNCQELDSLLESGGTKGISANYSLKLQNHQLGKLTVFAKTRYDEIELEILEDMLCALIYPMKNALMYQIALKSAYRDPLTGLNNRTSMEKFLPREIELAKRHRQSMALLVMDLDGFKRINDSYGHDVGDQVLREVGSVIGRAMRNTDLVYRYGGDEFVGGLAQTDVHGAIDVCERIRRNIERLDLNGCDSELQVRVSIGITLICERDELNMAFKRADNALYQAKMNGKNQIIIC